MSWLSFSVYLCRKVWARMIITNIADFIQRQRSSDSRQSKAWLQKVTIPSFLWMLSDDWETGGKEKGSFWSLILPLIRNNCCRFSKCKCFCSPGPSGDGTMASTFVLEILLPNRKVWVSPCQGSLHSPLIGCGWDHWQQWVSLQFQVHPAGRCHKKKAKNRLV